MPRTLSTKTAVPSATTPLADVYRVLEVNINNEASSLHVFYGAYESQADIDVANPEYIEPVTEVLDADGVTVLVEGVEGTPSLPLTIKLAVADVQTHREGVRYEGEDMLALANSATLAGETLHDAIKRVLYAKLEADGYFPSGGADTDSEAS